MSKITRTNLLCALTIAAVWLTVAFLPQKTVVPALAAMSTVLTLLAFFFYSCQQDNPWEETQSMLTGMPAAVDPWAMQRELMRRSDQPLPDAPVLSKNGLMYAALVMEETSEAYCQSIVPALDRMLLMPTSRCMSADQVRALKVIRGKIQEHGFRAAVESKIIRQHLKDVADFRVLLNRDEAINGFDGVTDMAVVVCGLTLAMGFDGAAGYAEIAGSNLSKANPDTGKIEKTSDGKWIKGRLYVEPDLVHILDEHAAGLNPQ